MQGSFRTRRIARIAYFRCCNVGKFPDSHPRYPDPGGFVCLSAS
jgi:hypothetical protein